MIPIEKEQEFNHLDYETKEERIKAYSKYRYQKKKKQLNKEKVEWMRTPRGYYSVVRSRTKKNYGIEHDDFDNLIKRGCQKCGFQEDWVLDIHHIDGNHKNNDRNNLMYLCPNCHHRKERRKFIIH
jgi:5-methylcytosine-specific restriction endonuclease McrA